MMDKITEIIPDDIPQWAQDAIDKGLLWKTVFARIKELEGIDRQKTEEHNINLVSLAIAKERIEQLEAERLELQIENLGLQDEIEKYQLQISQIVSFVSPDELIDDKDTVIYGRGREHSE